MSKPKGKSENQHIDILKVEVGRVEFAIKGTSPLYLNRLSEKAKRELLLPGGRKTAVERATTLKHDPRTEFQASPYRLTATSLPTHLALPTTAFKGAIMTAALDLPGTKKAQIGRLTYVEGHYVYVYGVPRLSMTGVRDANGTPDIRSRAVIPEWVCKISVTFAKPTLTGQAITNLLTAAGHFVGVGDWRQEKGKGNFGKFEVCDPDDADFKRIVKTGGWKAQYDAMENPVCHDAESAELLAWFDAEIKRRQLRGVV